MDKILDLLGGNNWIVIVIAILFFKDDLLGLLSKIRTKPPVTTVPVVDPADPKNPLLQQLFAIFLQQLLAKEQKALQDSAKEPS